MATAGSLKYPFLVTSITREPGGCGRLDWARANVERRSASKNFFIADRRSDSAAASCFELHIELFHPGFQQVADREHAQQASFLVEHGKMADVMAEHHLQRFLFGSVFMGGEHGRGHQLG